MTPKTNKDLAIIFSCFGPYHLSRLEAIGKLAKESGFDLQGIEVCSFGGPYAWDRATAPCQFFERITLFPERGYHDLTRQEIRSAVVAVLDRVHPDVVAIPGWSFAEAIAALGWCRKNAHGVICMSDSKVDDMPRCWLKEWVKKRIVLPQFSAALVAGRPHAHYLGALGFQHKKIFQGYDVVDNEYFRRSALLIRQDCRHWAQERQLPRRFFLITARFIPEKNLSRALDAYARYRQAVSAPWALVIVGSGDLAGALHAQVEQLGLSGVHWLGFVQYPELPALYALASAFLFPSVKDTWGLAVNEAMACGLPVLVSRKAGCSLDLVEDGTNGYLFDPCLVGEIAEVMVRMSELTDDARAAMGRRSQEIIAQWGPDRFAQGMLQAVKMAMQRPHNTGIMDRILCTIFAKMS